MNVTVELTTDEGFTMLGYSRVEVVIGSGEPEEDALTTGQKLLDTIDEAKDSVSAQIRNMNRAVGG